MPRCRKRNAPPKVFSLLNPSIRSLSFAQLLQAQPQSVQADESFGARLLIDGILFKSRHLGIVERSIGLTPGDNDTALVKLQPRCSVYLALRRVDCPLQELTFRR